MGERGPKAPKKDEAKWIRLRRSTRTPHGARRRAAPRRAPALSGGLPRSGWGLTCWARVSA
ncbi:hypothetical protein GCM10009097_01090 [Pigmentiphaga daeguensis]|uniref:Uncharacterized protein n=1 Tax=Pigmentiphaga daeguensis TaxID=414049 RepID=A0ABN1B3R3_9BURK